MMDVPGPFDPLPLHAQYDPRSLEDPWYAFTYVILDGVKRWKGEVFVRRQDSLEEWYAEQAGLIRPSLLPTDPRWHLWRSLGREIVRTKEYRPTGRHFISETSFYECVRRYEQQDLEAIEWVVPQPPDTTDTAEPEDNSQSELPTSLQPRGPASHYTAWTNAQALRIFKRAAQKVRRAGLPLSHKHLGHYLTPRRHRNTVGKMLKHHGLTFDDL